MSTTDHGFNGGKVLCYCIWGGVSILPVNSMPSSFTLLKSNMLHTLLHPWRSLNLSLAEVKKSSCKVIANSDGCILAVEAMCHPCAICRGDSTTPWTKFILIHVFHFLFYFITYPSSLLLVKCIPSNCQVHDFTVSHVGAASAMNHTRTALLISLALVSQLQSCFPVGFSLAPANFSLVELSHYSEDVSKIAAGLSHMHQYSHADTVIYDIVTHTHAKKLTRKKWRKGHQV